MRVSRREFLAAGGSVCLAGCSTTVGRLEDLVSQGNRGVPRRIDADPDAGFHYPYFLAEPRAERDGPLPVFVQPHNAPSVSTRDELHTQVGQRVHEYLRTAGELGLPGVVPAFPRTPDDGADLVQNLSLPSLGGGERLRQIGTSEFPAATLERVDEQFLRMLADARKRLTGKGYDIADGVHMLGFSSSGQFASRFAFLYPNRVRAISVGGDGAHPLPMASIGGISLPYPLGTADYRSVTGRSFDLDAWRDVHRFIFVGEADQPLPETDPRSYYDVSVRYADEAVAIYGRNRVTERLPVTRSIYEEVGANATFRVYPGVGHRHTQNMQADVQEFHGKALGSSPGEPITMASKNVPPEPSDVPADTSPNGVWAIEFADPPRSGTAHVVVNATVPTEAQTTEDLGIWVFEGDGVDMNSQLRDAPAILHDHVTTERKVELDPGHPAVPLTEDQLVTVALMDDPDEGPSVVTTTPVS